jgi:hypothetical protein
MPGFPALSLAAYKRYTKRQREVQQRAIQARYYEYGSEHLSPRTRPGRRGRPGRPFDATSAASRSGFGS